jgi:hypothetical protein
MIEEYLIEIIESIIQEKMKDVVADLIQLKPAEKEFYSLSDVATILSITESGLKARAKAGKIQLIWDQNNVTVHKKELERYKKMYLYPQINKGRV